MLEAKLSKCPECGDEAHEPGQSPRSNCGEGDIQHLYDRGHVGSLDDMDYQLPMRSSLYTRKGIPRKKLTY